MLMFKSDFQVYFIYIHGSPSKKQNSAMCKLSSASVTFPTVIPKCAQTMYSGIVIVVAVGKAFKWPQSA